MQLTNNELKTLQYGKYCSAMAGEAILFQANSNLSNRQREFLTKKLIQRWNSHDVLLEALKMVKVRLEANQQILLKYEDKYSAYTTANTQIYTRLLQVIADSEV